MHFLSSRSAVLTIVGIVWFLAGSNKASQIGVGMIGAPVLIVRALTSAHAGVEMSPVRKTVFIITHTASFPHKAVVVDKLVITCSGHEGPPT